MSRRELLIRLLLVIALGLGASATSGRSRSLMSERCQTDIQYLPRGDVLKLMSLGYDEMVADMIWLQAILYYGEWRKGEHGILFFEKMADAVITLDPHFEQAYRFVGMVLAEDMGRPEEGIDFLRRGMVNLPESWVLPFDAGFIEYNVTMNDARAFRWFKYAAEIPGAPEYPRRFAAFVAGRAGELEVSYELWRYVAVTTANEELKQKAEQYMEDLAKAIRGEGPVPEWARRQRLINGRTIDGGGGA